MALVARWWMLNQPPISESLQRDDISQDDKTSLRLHTNPAESGEGPRQVLLRAPDLRREELLLERQDKSRRRRVWIGHKLVEELGKALRCRAEFNLGQLLREPLTRFQRMLEEREPQ